MQYLNGTSLSQSILASKEHLNTSSSAGTDTNVMATYLTNNTDKTYSVLWWWKDANALSELVINSIKSDKPIIGHVVIKDKGDWAYETEGHYLNYNGYRANGATFCVTDPWIDRYGNTTGKYTISATEAERVTDRLIL